MSYVSKEAAKALKEVGFKGDVNFYYKIKSDHDNGEKLQFTNQVGDWNHGPWYSAPNHLEAADWLAEKHDLYLVFAKDTTQLQVYDFKDQDELIETLNFDQSGHRDLAIIEACKIIKERKLPPPPAEGRGKATRFAQKQCDSRRFAI